MNEVSRSDGIPDELFEILKDDAVKSASLNMPADLENSAVATGLKKGQFLFQSQRKSMPKIFKLPHNCTHFTHWQSNTQILQARLQQ